MSEKNSQPKVGQVLWRDLTVRDATQVRGFYRDVVGWTSTDHDMGEYQDYNMIVPETGETVAGVCHARGVNADVPPQWLMYIIVEDVDRSAKTCVELGGQIMAGPRQMGGGRFCVIKDPAGAMCALFKP
jgi:predicted enzyme related to lactoylglutathione lyase